MNKSSEKKYIAAQIILLVAAIFYSYLDIKFSHIYYEYAVNTVFVVLLVYIFSKHFSVEHRNKKTLIIMMSIAAIVLLFASAQTIKAYSSKELYTYAGVVLCFIFLGGFLVSLKNEKYTVSMMAHIGMSVALAYVLSFLKIWKMPQGGSVSLAMVPIILIANMYGIRQSMITAYLYGIVNFMLNPYIVHPIQIFLDYQLAFVLIGIAGYFRAVPNMFLYAGIPLAFLARGIVHIISGVVFFAEYAPENMDPLWYSIVYNGTYIIPEAIICIIIMSGMISKFKQKDL